MLILFKMQGDSGHFPVVENFIQLGRRWVEIKINGTTYVFDPDFTNETGRNGYMITYGQSGTWRYNRGSVMQ